MSDINVENIINKHMGNLIENILKECSNVSIDVSQSVKDMKDVSIEMSHFLPSLYVEREYFNILDECVRKGEGYGSRFVWTDPRLFTDSQHPPFLVFDDSKISFGDEWFQIQVYRNMDVHEFNLGGQGIDTLKEKNECAPLVAELVMKSLVSCHEELYNLKYGASNE